MLVRRLHLLFMSTRLRLEFADPFRHGDGTHATLSAADPDRGYNMVDVNADALVILTRAVMSELPQFEWTPEIAGRRVLLEGCLDVSDSSVVYAGVQSGGCSAGD